MYSVPSLLGDGFFDSVFDDFSRLMKSPKFSFDDSFPPINLYVNMDSNACIFEIALTGYKKDWLNVEIDGSTLAITAEVPEEKDGERKYLKRRIQARSFKKMYKIPEGYSSSKAEVTYEDGLLTVYIPVEERKSSARRLLIH